MPNLTQSILLAVEYVNGRMPGLDGWMYGTLGHFFVLGCMFQSWGCKIIGRLLLLNDLILNSTSGGILDSSRLGSQLFPRRASELRVLLKRGGKIFFYISVHIFTYFYISLHIFIYISLHFTVHLHILHFYILYLYILHVHIFTSCIFKPYIFISYVTPYIFTSLLTSLLS